MSGCFPRQNICQTQSTRFRAAGKGIDFPADRPRRNDPAGCPGRDDPVGRPWREGMSPVGSPRRSEIFAESQKSPNPRTPAGFTPCCASRGTGHPLRAAGGTFPRVDTLPDLTPDRQETQQWTSRFCLKTGNAAKVNENQGSCRITSQNTAKVNESDNEFG